MALASVRVLMYEGFGSRFPFGVGERSEALKVPAEGEGCLEFTKGEVEKIAGESRASKLIAVAPEIRVAKIVFCRTEATSAETARFVKSCLGNTGQDTNVICVKGAEWKEETVV